MALVFIFGCKQPRAPRDTNTTTTTTTLRTSRASVHCDADVVIEKEKYQHWLSTFTASDPAYQDYCTNVLHGDKTPGRGAQVSQDVFLFHNIFKKWAVRGQKGFYVESGANEPEKLSSSLFFDKCLGWDGLCVEPQPQYHEVRSTLLWNLECSTILAQHVQCVPKTLHLVMAQHAHFVL